MNKDKKSFFERLTGAVRVDQDRGDMVAETPRGRNDQIPEKAEWVADEQPDGELTVDVYQNADEIIIKTMVAGVRPEDLDISITRDMVAIKGTRETDNEVAGEDYFHRELYWGSFSRTIVLPEEVDVESAEASENYGLLTITLPKVDKHRQTKLRVKSKA